MKWRMEDWLVQLNDKVRGSMIGGAAGDALGYVVEFDADTCSLSKGDRQALI